MSRDASFTVRIDSDAEDDLAAITAYVIEHHSSQAALNLVDELLDRIAALERFPFRGSRPKELAQMGEDEYRQLLVGRYRVIYEVEGRTVTVVLVADGRRDMQSLLRDRLLRGRDPD